jgi:hypothetical protein
LAIYELKHFGLYCVKLCIFTFAIFRHKFMKKIFLQFYGAIFALVVLGLSVNAQSRSETFAITGAQITTVSGPTISRGTIVVRDGLIEAVGENVKVPADARVIDGTGLIVYPGFFDTNTSLGFAAPRPGGQVGQPAQTTQLQTAQPQSNSNYPAGLQPEESAVEQLKAGEAQFETNRNAGFTTVLTVSREGVYNGQSAVINLAGDSVSQMIVPRSVRFAFHFYRASDGSVSDIFNGNFCRVSADDARRAETSGKQAGV